MTMVMETRSMQQTFIMHQQVERENPPSSMTHRVVVKEEEEAEERVCNETEKKQACVSSGGFQSPGSPRSLRQREFQENGMEIDTRNVVHVDENDEDSSSTPLSPAEEAHQLSIVKREIILILSQAHKSATGGDRPKAMALLKALYQAETRSEIDALGHQIHDLLNKQRRQQQQLEEEEEEERRRRASEHPERFSRFRATIGRFFHPEQYPSSSPSSLSYNQHQQRSAFGYRNGRFSSPQEYHHGRNQETATTPGRWRFFWQRTGGGHTNSNGVDEDRPRRRPSLSGYGESGINMENTNGSTWKGSFRRHEGNVISTKTV